MSRVLTRSGRMLDLADEAPAFYLPDIALSLSRECRFSGQTNLFFSVAQHSICVAKLVPQEFILEALLHDAHEAFLRDLATPIKNLLPDYCALEKMVDKKIRRHFGLPETMSPEVVKADQRALNIERALFLPAHDKWPVDPDLALPLVKMFIPISADEALHEFLKMVNCK